MCLEIVLTWMRLSEFAKKITVVSMIGHDKKHLTDIKFNLPKNVKTRFIFKENSPTIVKKRYLDSVSNNKIIGIYKINDEILNVKNEKKLHEILIKEFDKHDLVIVSDYGHGFISKKSANLICKKSKFLALNAQVNASNIGYHTIRNYKNFDTLIINEKEIRQEMRDKISKLENIISKLSREKRIKNLIVTMGKSGSI